ncbi:tRNA (guanosine(18)-2'-O)-methyltransferase TrmH [soil metagenome]
MLADMTLRRLQRIEKVLAKRQPDLSILAEDVYKPHNLSAMLRSCDAVGIGTVHAVNPTGGVPTYNETSASADKWVEVVVHDSILSALDVLKAGNIQILAAHLSNQAEDYRDVDYTRPTCIVFGNEKNGVSEVAAQRADAHIIIPMLGMVQSLNVSVATAVVLFEAQRQRRAAGLYDAPRLDVATRQAQTFAWLYPREAASLRAAGQLFPALDDEGGVVR